jgi:hypothetical protein
MSKYYLICWKHKAELPSAIYATQHQVAHELIPQLHKKKVLPYDFELKRVVETNDGLVTDDNLISLSEIWLDYQPNSLTWPLMSEKLKSLIEACLTGNEKIDWISCKINNRKEERTYFILRFNKMLDVLDEQNTVFVQGTDHIIKPAYSLKKIKSYNIFPIPSPHDLWKITSGLCVSEALKREIQKQKITGIEFEKVLVIS